MYTIIYHCISLLSQEIPIIFQDFTPGFSQHVPSVDSPARPYVGQHQGKIGRHNQTCVGGVH